MFFLSHCYQSPLPLWESQSTSPAWDALQHCAGLWTCCGGNSDSNLVLLLCVLAVKCPQLSEVCFLLWELTMFFYIFYRHRVSLVGCMDLICSLYSWWEGFGSSSLATPPLGFNCDFISTSACESSTGVCS